MTEQWMIIAILSLAVCALAGYVALLSRRLAGVIQQQEQQTGKIRRELAAMNSAAIGVGQRLISAEKKLNAAVEKQDQAIQHNDAEPLEQAASSARRGVSAEELIDRYGLSEAEANLLALLKTQGATAAGEPTSHY